MDREPNTKTDLKQIEKLEKQLFQLYKNTIKDNIEWSLDEFGTTQDAFGKNIVVTSRIKNFKNKLSRLILPKYDIKPKGQFPFQWMLADPEIENLIHTYKYAMPFLNYNQKMVTVYPDIYREKLVELCDEITGGLKFKNKKRMYNFMAIISDKEYYRDITNELGCSHEVIRRLLSAFSEADLYKDFGVIKPGKKRLGTLYAIGYYQERDGHRPKPVSFVIKNRIDALKAAFYQLAITKS